MYRVWVRSFGGFRAGFERLLSEFFFLLLQMGVLAF